MYQIDKVKARKILVEEEHFNAFDADHLLKDYPLVRDPLDQAVQQWLKDRTVQQVQVEGLTIEQVMLNYQYHFLVAVKALNRLLDPSKTSEQRAKMRNTLSRPVDYL